MREQTSMTTLAAPRATTAGPLRLIIIALAGTIATASLPAAALAQSSMSRAELKRLMEPCLPDYRRLCSNVARGGGRILACLEQNKANVTPACATSLQTMTAAAKASGRLPN